MFDKLMWAIGLKWIGRRVADAAAGKYGEGWRKAYVFMQGHKTEDGVLLALVCACLLSVGKVGPAVAVAGVASLLVAAGLIDQAWRSAPESWASARWYMFLRAHWGWVVSISAALVSRYTTCDAVVAANLARLHLTCDKALILTAAATAVLGWAIGAAKLAEGPTGAGIVLQVKQVADL